MKKLILVSSFCLLILASCKKSEASAKEFKTPIDSIKYSNYIKLLDFGGGSLNPYIVVTVKNLNTGVVKEVCTYTDFLKGAIYHEYGVVNDEKRLRNNKQLYFQFKDTAALNNIGFDSYSMKELKAYKVKIKFDSLYPLIYKKRYPLIEFGENHDELNMYAHLLFNEGILSVHNSCLCSLQIIDDKFLEEHKKRIDEIIEMTKRNNAKK